MTMYGVVTNHKTNISIYDSYEEAKKWFESCQLIYEDVHVYELTEIIGYKFTHSLGGKAN